MLPVKSQYKIAKRLGAAIFEKTQSQKFAFSEARGRKPRPRRGISDFGKQLLEKQRVRFTYGLSERQLANYVKDASGKTDPSGVLHVYLEMRADSVVYRAGFASTRRSARQIVSHGHITVNGKRITTPSHRVRVGDVLAVREGSRESALFAALAEDQKEQGKLIPQWLASDLKLLRVEVKGTPSYSSTEVGLDYATVFEFYSR
ncbi:MAG: 30S ribosomal protein S4 [Patescibacteria group bacterium]|nr:30S ribosomal protein S4 [bacterium]MDZ4227593.1 30S ribosomal protein S4 [Patescibacteria group bacterium]